MWISGIIFKLLLNAISSSYCCAVISFPLAHKGVADLLDGFKIISLPIFAGLYYASYQLVAQWIATFFCSSPGTLTRDIKRTGN